MKVGDLVSWNGKAYIVTEVYESKCWRSESMGNKINWGQLDPEPFARILVDGDLRGIPQSDIEAIGEI